MRALIERLERIGHPKFRAIAAYDLGAKVRNFAGDIAMKLVDKDDPYGELARNFPKVKKAGDVMVKAMQNFAKEVFATEKYIDIEKEKKAKIKGVLRK